MSGAEQELVFNKNFSGLVYTVCYERTELIIYVARSGTLVACIFYLHVTTVSEPNLLIKL